MTHIAACRPGLTVALRWENDGMQKQHDPLCPKKAGQPCQCALIDAVEERVFESWSADLEHQRYH